MSMEKMRKSLAKVLMEKSYLEGDFTLSSGKKSDYYFDCRQSSLNPEGAYLIGNVFFQMMKNMDVQAVAGMTMGADPLVTATSLAAYAHDFALPALVIRKKAKGHGTGRFVEGLANVEKGQKIIMLEDVVSTGGSVLTACKRAEDAGLEVISIFCILNREEGAEEAIEKAGYPLKSIFTRSSLLEVAKNL